MATKKSKSSNKSRKDKSTKSKTATKTAEKTEVEAVKTTEAKTEKVKVEKTEKVEKKETSTKTVTTKNKSFLSGFFAKKYEEKESVLTIFKNQKFYGALLGEVIGTMLLALLFFSVMLLGLPNIATYAFAVIALIIAVYAFSGACLNPIITMGMVASRRMSVVRGVMYIIAEIVGAWLGWLIFNGFHLAGGETAYEIPTIAAIGEGKFWPLALIEIMGAFIIAFFYARAVKYKRSVFTYGAVIAGGLSLAVIVGYVISAAFLGANNNFIMNPALAMMLKIFPDSGADFGEIFGGICQALSLYVLLPMIAGVVGFYLSDFTAKLVSEE